MKFNANADVHDVWRSTQTELWYGMDVKTTCSGFNKLSIWRLNQSSEPGDRDYLTHVKLSKKSVSQSYPFMDRFEIVVVSCHHVTTPDKGPSFFEFQEYANANSDSSLFYMADMFVFGMKTVYVCDNTCTSHITKHTVTQTAQSVKRSKKLQTFLIKHSGHQGH